MKNNCLIFGGGGFIGSHLADELLNNDYNVTVFDKLNFSRSNIAHIENKINIIEGDFYNEVDILGSLPEVDYVFHLVSSTLPASSNMNPVYDVETNLISTLKLITECRNKNVKKIVFISSGGTVYGIPEYLPIKETHPLKPICSYGIVKRAIEDYLYMYCNLYGLDYTVFRLSNPYGERQNPFVAQGAIAVFLRKLILNEKIEIWGDGTVIRDYIYIKDAVSAVVKSLRLNSDSKVFNLSSAKGYNLNDLIGIMEKISGIKPHVKYVDSRGIDVKSNVLDNTLLKNTFNWNPEVNIEEGISLTYDYLNKFLK